ncbi:MAG: hypothetical protein SOT56_08455 [Eubacteriales bacterium]|nr:hypothetical protein [Eubacteriales bacterium]
MKKLSVFLCAVLLCSCAPTDYISVVPEESVSGAVMSSVAPEPPDGTEKDFTEHTSYITDSTSGVDAQTEKPPETTAVREPGKITVTYLTENVKKGSRATLSVAGTPGITYSITVYYSSSVSAAKGLEPKSADSNGNVSWSWRVGSRTKPGKHKIVISGGGESITLYFTTT